MSAGITAVVTLAVTAVLTPLGTLVGDATQSVFGSPDDDSPPATSSSGSPSVDPLRRVSDPSGALSVLVPQSWGVTHASDDTPYGNPRARTGQYTGTAMRSGDPVGISDPDGWAGSALYFAASRAAPADLDLVGADHDTLQAWADHYIEERDWTQSGCVLAGEEHPHVAGYLTAMRRWDRCEGLPDASLWELAGASDDGRVLLILQLLPGTVPEDTATAMVSSFAVAPERLPAKTNPSKSPIAP